ncbi:carbamoyl phosphate synthase small subunit [Tyzzerella sp. An114]|uniref:carbamoyl phosphate synthase small subunit n=1 Tax=Tyzzerella sp. An114 TaxID=1965545 RepID=UPI000B445DCA|nr:carbamoyl phosphate synthase small subunit [Tyzzerella sp. An114]OUQ60435.1 carbamoyl phosphate synthase small subunit [Tyzzerella sp. An114]
MEKLYLVLENGQIFEGKSFGAEGEITGEIVFSTAMTGYLETITDPSYFGQIVVQTFPLIGNYGVIPSDFESDRPYLKAYVVREWCQEPSNFRCEGNLDTFLKDMNVIGLYDIDTRQLTKIIREYGVMNAKITKSIDNIDEIIKELKGYKIVDAVKGATCKEMKVFNENGEKHVVLMDFGEKANIQRELIKRGCKVTVVPSYTKASEILAMNPDGIMLSNGPGDPAENVEVIEEIKALVESKTPIFGICLGHQLTALSQGATTSKLKYGHRGGNQPVKETATGRVYITSQNHGYAVNADSLPENAELSWVNVNDGTCEGVSYKNAPVYTVQFHPEACGGPQDTMFLFDKFINVMGGTK